MIKWAISIAIICAAVTGSMLASADQLDGPYGLVESYFSGSGQPAGDIDMAGQLITDSTGPVKHGTAGSSSHSLGVGDDFFGGKVEVDDTSYFDNGIIVAGATSFLSGGVLLNTITSIGSQLKLYDDIVIVYGTSVDYSSYYDSAGTQLSQWSTNCDGVGSDCVWMSVQDGTDDVAFSGTVTSVGLVTSGLEADLTAGACTAGTWKIDTGGATRELCRCNDAGSAYDCVSVTTANGPID